MRRILIGAALLLPLIAVAAIVGAISLRGSDRFDPRYFTAQYQQRYDAPGRAAEGFEAAIQTGNMDLMRELVATRADPAAIQQQSDLLLYDMRNKSGDYYNYLYVTQDRRHRQLAHVKLENGRYIVAEEDLFYLVDSGNWPRAFAPLLITYYVLFGLAFGVVRISRRAKRRREPEAG